MSDSGTPYRRGFLLNLPAVTIRNAHEPGRYGCRHAYHAWIEAGAVLEPLASSLPSMIAISMRRVRWRSMRIPQWPDRCCGRDELHRHVKRTVAPGDLADDRSRDRRQWVGRSGAHRHHMHQRGVACRGVVRRAALQRSADDVVMEQNGQTDGSRCWQAWL